MADRREAKNLIKQHKEWLKSLKMLESNLPMLRDEITRTQKNASRFLLEV